MTDDFETTLSRHYTALIALHHSREAFTHAYALRALQDLAITPEQRQELDNAVSILGRLFQEIDSRHADVSEALDWMLQDMGLEDRQS